MILSALGFVGKKTLLVWSGPVRARPQQFQNRKAEALSILLYEIFV